MRTRIALLTTLAILTTLGCRSAGREWERAPLAPPLQLSEPVASGEVVVLLLDAHSGAKVGGERSGAVVTLASKASAQIRLMEHVDSTGRVRFRGVPAGTYDLRVIAFGYDELRAPGSGN
jgi:hypothetical protein